MIAIEIRTRSKYFAVISGGTSCGRVRLKLRPELLGYSVLDLSENVHFIAGHAYLLISFLI